MKTSFVSKKTTINRRFFDKHVTILLNHTLYNLGPFKANGACAFVLNKGEICMKRLLGLVLLIAAFSAGAFAQANAGLAAISGTVHDGTGAVIPGAMVTVTNETRGIERTTLSTEAGVFAVPALVPSSGYSLKVTLQGFKTWEAKNFDLQVGQTADFRVTLDVAGAAAEVSVTAEAPLVDETKSGLSQVVNQEQIDNLPINGRRVDSFVLLTPGVTNDGNFGLLTFRGIANGNSFLLDGNDSTERFFMENNGRTRVVSQISQDAVQEFQVVSADFSAEYGRASGGVVNTVTRSGTNGLHGTAYTFYRDKSFNAHDPYAPVDSTVTPISPIINPPDERYQSGASLGGPLVKDKLFYFVNGEYTHRNFPIADNLIRAGVVDTANQVWVGCGVAANGLPAATPAQCSAINSVLPRFFGQVPRTMGQPLGFGRLDYRYSDRNTFSASFNYMHFRAHNGLQNTLITSTTGAGINTNGNDYGQVRNMKFSWTSVPNSRLVNEFRYGWSTDLEGDDPNPELLSPVLGYLDASVAGVQLGTTNYLPRVEPNEHKHEFADTATWTKGPHIIKFGADITTADDYALFLLNLHGSYTYQTVNAFALDFSGNTTGAKSWQSYSQTLGSGTTDMRINNFSFYGQDQWRITPKLTANFGLRYEYEPLPQPTTCNPDYPQTCKINRNAANFMPRIGLSYRVNDKTVVRTGYGIYYASIPGATLMNLFLGNGVIQQAVSLSNSQATQLAQGPVFPNNLGAVPAGFKSGPTSIQFAAPNWKTPYSEQGTLAIERELFRDVALSATYIWSRGIHLYGETDLNMPALSSTTYTYKIADAKGVPTGATFTTPMYLGARPNPNYNGVVQADNGVDSYYNGLALQLQKRFSHGLQGNVAYTWSHEIDDGQGIGQATQNIFLSNAFAWTYNGNYRYDRGDGLEDQRQRLAINWVWAPKFTERSDVFSKFLVNNWQLSSLTTINSSRPAAAPTIRDNDTTATAPVPGMVSFFSINGSGLGSRVPFMPMNSIYQPALYKTDARISKVLPFGMDGQYKLFLNFEVFNVTNSWSPTSMSSQAYTESGGTLTLTPTAFNQGIGDSTPPDGTLARRMQVSVRFQF
jgi:Carboxypeptidase regulatory-like domain/TonB-dependent Receptor Plug Domain/TonB dependent receptor